MKHHLGRLAGRLRGASPSAAPASERADGRAARPVAEPDDDDVAEAVSAEHRRILDRVREATMTSDERVLGVIDAVEHVVRHRVEGDLVECGVWRGGSVLAMILTLQHLGVDDRDLHLYDTFEGMTEPTEADTSAFSEAALTEWREAETNQLHPWSEAFGPEVFGRRQVEDLLATSGYPSERLHFVEGPVEQTIPGHVPDRIAVLRLDTDWYESTRHELEHLYPRLERNGVLIVDDYGHWDGCRQAVDEYFATEAARPLLSRLDYTGRIGVKV